MTLPYTEICLIRTFSRTQRMELSTSRRPCVHISLGVALMSFCIVFWAFSTAVEVTRNSFSSFPSLNVTDEIAERMDGHNARPCENPCQLLWQDPQSKCQDCSGEHREKTEVRKRRDSSSYFRCSIAGWATAPGAAWSRKPTAYIRLG